MYIPEFIAGVLTTILAEVALIIGICIYKMKKGGKK